MTKSSSIAKLGDFMPNKPERHKKEMDKVPGIYLKKLASALGNECAGKKIGMTVSGVAAALADQEGVRRSVELAARYIYEKEHGGQDVHRMAMVKAPAHTLKTIRDIVATSGGRVAIMPDDNGKD